MVGYTDTMPEAIKFGENTVDVTESMRYGFGMGAAVTGDVS